MKIIYSQGKTSLCILDDDNYGVFDNTKPHMVKKDDTEHLSYEYRYYSSISQALVKMAKNIANDECIDLKSWKESYEQGVRRIELACGVKI